MHVMLDTYEEISWTGRYKARMWISGTLWIATLSSNRDSSFLAYGICKKNKQTFTPSLKSLRRALTKTDPQRAPLGCLRAINQHSPVQWSKQQWIHLTILLFRLQFTILLQKEPWETESDSWSQDWCHPRYSTALCASDTPDSMKKNLLLDFPWPSLICLG